MVGASRNSKASSNERRSSAIDDIGRIGSLAFHAPHRPTLLTVVRRVSLSLLIAVVVPAVVFYVVFVLAGVWTAIAAALAWSYGAIAWRR